MRSIVTLWVGLVLVAAAAGAQSEPAVGPSVIVVVGAPGMEEYAGQFAGWAQRWEQACEKAGVTSKVIGLNDTAPQPDCNDLRDTLASEPKETDAPLWLILIGHGTYDGRTARFNLRGPDVSAEQLGTWLEPLSRPVAIVNTASSSAPFLNKLSATDRIVVTATKSGFEQNYARFGQFIAEAIIDPTADLDKDGQTSLLEAFLTASHQTSEFYSTAGRLATEHALLDDNGDGFGTPADWFRGIRPVERAADGAELDGYRAHQLCLLYSEAEADMPPALRAERDRLELEVMQLRDSKESLSENAYYTRLEALLYRLAKIYQQLDEAETGSDGPTARAQD